MSLFALPSDVLLLIISFLDVQDKCWLSITCEYFYRFLHSRPECWSPLDLSAFSDRITNITLLSILRNRSMPIVRVKRDKYTARTATIDRVNISGCWALSSDVLVTLAFTLPFLTELHLNKYPSGDTVLPIEQRDHLYLVRPNHNLLFLSTDLSKPLTPCLTLPERTLEKMLFNTQCLETLSLQYQSLGIDTCQAFAELKHLKHLDISSCAITQPALQVLLRNVATQLSSLIVINVCLTNLTLLCLQQYGVSIRRLHLSCAEPEMLPSLKRLLSHLKIEDFRLTQVRSNSVDPIVQVLDPTVLRRIDISPKMDLYPIYPRSVPYADQTQAEKIDPRRRSQPKFYLCRDESELMFNHHTLGHLATFSHLTELRLCFPDTLTAPSLTAFFQSSPHLEIFEYRMFATSRRPKQCPSNEKVDLMTGLRSHHTPNLSQIHLFSVWISEATASALCDMKHLRQITVCDGGSISDRDPSFLRRWLTSLHNLETVRFGKTRLHLDSMDDIAVRKEKIIGTNTRYVDTLSSCELLAQNSAEGEYIFQKKSGTWRWATK